MAKGRRVVEIEVDGERWLVSKRGTTWDFTWLTGPNNGYGFSWGASDGSAPSREQMISEIQAFLGAINPETGYLD
ncbi:hypothetical protein ACF3NT_09905 [Naumannella halotolerans]|uniref:hypothetical protein n=1 Tax=Naumannella halotolerans TaxID=993414 RepID=UPI00370D827F